MIKKIIDYTAFFFIVVGFTLFMVKQCEYDQKRNDAQNIEFSQEDK